MTGAEFSGVDFDLLADYVGGALDGTPDEAIVGALIASDPSWRAAYTELSQAMATVGAELSAMGAVAEPMPADLVARLDAAFASAAVTDDAPAGAAGATAVGANTVDVTAMGGAATDATDTAASDVPEMVASPVGVAGSAGASADGVGRRLSAVPSDPDRVAPARKGATAAERRRRLRWAAPIAAAAGIIAFAGITTQYFLQTAASENRASTSSGSNAAGGVADQSTLAQPGAESAPGQSRQASGTDYQPGTLGDGSMRAFRNSTGPTNSAKTTDAPQVAPLPMAPAFPDNVPDQLRPLIEPAMLQACLDAVAAQNDAGPITSQDIDYARYQGSPALVVRFSAANGSWVWATGPRCGTPGAGAARLAAVKVG